MSSLVDFSQRAMISTTFFAVTIYGAVGLSAVGSQAKAPQHVQSASGKATIYSDKFNGKKTATGEKFRQDKLTAASPHLPLGSRVKVTNKKTGKSITVKVNDRQPRGGNRVVDLSKAAANKLGIKGTGSVKTQVVGK